jgi:hypothetical protein
VHVLTARERVVVTAIAEAYFPSTDAAGLDKAAAGVAPYIDTLLARLALDKRLQLRALLMIVEVGTAIQRRGVLFSAAALDERIGRLRAWERSDRYLVRMLFAALLRIFTLGYLADPEVPRRIGIPARIPQPPAPVRRSARKHRALNAPRVRRLERYWSTDHILTGIELPRLVRILAGGRYRLSARYMPRTAWIAGWSVAATAVGSIERARYDRRIAASVVEPPPIIILGHWRTGTTHLHNLLGRDPANTYSSMYQVVFPTTFMSTSGTFFPKVTARLLSDTRGFDNMANGWDEPAEDEIALAKLTGLSPFLSVMVPDHAPKFERYLDFLEVRKDERDEWKAALRWFVAKIRMHSGGRRPVVKSCVHTARIRMLLEVFPDAKFVHVHRNPFTVAASTIHMRNRVDWDNFLQVPKAEYVAERATQVVVIGQRIYERFFEDRALIPPSNFVDVAYADLAARPREVLDHIYRRLELPKVPEYEPTMSRYLDSVKGYRTNVLTIDDHLASLVREHWSSVFTEYGYSTDHRLS